MVMLFLVASTGPILNRLGDLTAGSTMGIGLSSVRMMPMTDPSENAITQAAEDVNETRSFFF